MNDSLKYINDLINSPTLQFAMQNAKTIQEAKEIIEPFHGSIALQTEYQERGYIFSALDPFLRNVEDLTPVLDTVQAGRRNPVDRVDCQKKCGRMKQNADNDMEYVRKRIQMKGFYRNKIFLFLITGILIFFMTIGTGSTSYAYTEEEKAAAKAWLSAHGYSPDAGGASQAYQDYLDGKFDEELGITTTEEASTQTATEEGTVVEEIEEEDEDSEEEQEASVSHFTNTSEDTTGAADGEATGSVPGMEEQSDGSDNMIEQPGQAEENAGSDESEEQETVQKITLYQKEKMDTYKEAGMVIALSVMLLVVIKGVALLMK
ncbi:MAG: hypothetical protein ACI4A3_13580 [Lachnospiraceae bacterium]